MILSKKVKELRIKHGLTQAQLGKAIFSSESTISNYENGNRNISWETLNDIAKVFGCTVEVDFVEDKNSSKRVGFYSKKTYKEILEMPTENLIDYLFVSQNDDVLASICYMNKNIFSVLKPTTKKDILSEMVKKSNRISIYFMLNNLYENVEDDMGILIEDTINYLKNEVDISNEVYNDVYYINFDLYGDLLHCELETDCMQLLDKDMNVLDISHDTIFKDGDIPLFSQAQSLDLLEFIKSNPIVKLKY